MANAEPVRLPVQPERKPELSEAARLAGWQEVREWLIRRALAKLAPPPPTEP